MKTASTTSIEDRLAGIEASLSKLTAGLNQAPTMLSIATDSVDELLSKANQNGTDVDQRIQNGLQLLGRLSDPKVSTALNNLLDMVDKAPGLVSMVADAADEQIAKANQGNISLEDRIAGMTKLLGKISDPSMVEKVENLIKLTDQGPGLMAMMVDSMDEFMAKNSMLDPQNLTFLKQSGEALTQAINEPPAKVGGLFGLLRSLKDPDRQKALGLLMNVLKNLGNKL